MSETKLVAIYRSQGILAAQVVKAKLDAAGVPALLKYESAGLVFGLTVDGLGLVEVLVPEDWQAEAEALVAEEPEDDAAAFEDTDDEEPGLADTGPDDLQ